MKLFAPLMLAAAASAKSVTELWFGNSESYGAQWSAWDFGGLTSEYKSLLFNYIQYYISGEFDSPRWHLYEDSKWESTIWEQLCDMKERFYWDLFCTNWNNVDLDIVVEYLGEYKHLEEAYCMMMTEMPIKEKRLRQEYVDDAELPLWEVGIECLLVAHNDWISQVKIDQPDVWQYFWDCGVLNDYEIPFAQVANPKGWKGFYSVQTLLGQCNVRKN
jgi:hypothetical protein